MKLRIYISGTSKESDYRNYIKRKYGNLPDVEIVDPLEETLEKIEKHIKNSVSCFYLVRNDKMLIDSCHIVVAYISGGPTWGTAMEIMYSFMKGIPIYIIDKTGENANYPWIKAHAKGFFNDIDSCFDFICFNFLKEKVK